ncbi:MAG: hypothetical protein MJ071_02940 [Oscillospiraceae bacterium]|nr:hypothetical protein [Oscillospiraceae bacterium]
MKSWIQTVRIGFAAGCAVILAVPSVMMLVPQIRERNAENSENRELVSFPSFRRDDGTLDISCLPVTGDWFSDHFAFRTDLIRAYGALTKFIFSESSQPDVILGKNDWLYYTPTINDVSGVSTISEAGIQHMVQNLHLMQQYAESNGAKLVLAVAPNKGSIYPEYLPSRYLHTGEMNHLDMLMQALENTDIAVCDWRTYLRNEKEKGGEQLYHKLDTHWNGAGAMAAYEAMMQTLELDDAGFSAYPKRETNDWEGDLWGMLSPGRKNPDTNYVYDIPQTYRAVGRMRSTDDMTIRTKNAQGSGSCLMFRDSFGRAMIPLFSQRFQSCTYSRATEVPLNETAESDVDYVIYEVVERNLENLILYSPYIPAPMADAPAAASETADINLLNLKTETDGTFMRIYGSYDIAYTDCERIICGVECDGGMQYYDAFLTCSSDETNADTVNENGFSLRLPVSQVQGNCNVQIFGMRSGEIIFLGSTSLQGA